MSVYRLVLDGADGGTDEECIRSERLARLALAHFANEPATHLRNGERATHVTLFEWEPDGWVLVGMESVRRTPLAEAAAAVLELLAELDREAIAAAELADDIAGRLRREAGARWDALYAGKGNALAMGISVGQTGSAA